MMTTTTTTTMTRQLGVWSGSAAVGAELLVAQCAAPTLPRLPAAASLAEGFMDNRTQEPLFVQRRTARPYTNVLHRTWMEVQQPDSLPSSNWMQRDPSGDQTEQTEKPEQTEQPEQPGQAEQPGHLSQVIRISKKERRQPALEKVIELLSPPPRALVVNYSRVINVTKWATEVERSTLESIPWGRDWSAIIPSVDLVLRKITKSEKGRDGVPIDGWYLVFEVLETTDNKKSSKIRNHKFCVITFAENIAFQHAIKAWTLDATNKDDVAERFMVNPGAFSLKRVQIIKVGDPPKVQHPVMRDSNKTVREECKNSPILHAVAAALRRRAGGETRTQSRQPGSRLSARPQAEASSVRLAAMVGGATEAPSVTGLPLAIFDKYGCLRAVQMGESAYWDWYAQRPIQKLPEQVRGDVAV